MSDSKQGFERFVNTSSAMAMAQSGGPSGLTQPPHPPVMAQTGSQVNATGPVPTTSVVPDMVSYFLNQCSQELTRSRMPVVDSGNSEMQNAGQGYFRQTIGPDGYPAMQLHQINPEPRSTAEIVGGGREEMGEGQVSWRPWASCQKAGARMLVLVFGSLK